MSDRYEYHSHCVFNLGYHVIFCPKYRRKVLQWGIDERLKILLVEKATVMGCRKLLEDIYDRMTDEEKKLFVQMTLQQRSTDDILKAVGQQSAQIQDLRSRQQTFAGSFASNLAGNAVWDGAMWLADRLSRLIR